MIKQYLGERIAFYFAMQAFYTMWLVPVALLGILVSVD